MAKSEQPLLERVALVAGATRGAGRGIARALAEAGAFVYCTGRSVAGRKGMDRPETLGETVALIEQAGGRAVAVGVDHTREEEVAALTQRLRTEHGRLDILVDSIWGGDPMVDWSKRFWEIDLDNLRPYVDQTLLSHIITSWARYCQIHQDPARRDLATLLAKALGLEGVGPGIAPAGPHA